MQFGDAAHDREPEPGTAGAAAVAPPEPLEDQPRAPSHGDPGPSSSTLTVPSFSTTNSTVVCGEVWLMAFSARLRMARASISALPRTQTGPVGAGQRDLLVLATAPAAQRIRRRSNGTLHCRSARSSGIDLEGIELGNLEQLADHARHGFDIVAQRTGRPSCPAASPCASAGSSAACAIRGLRQR